MTKDASVSKVPPHSEEAERAVLGSCLQDEAAIMLCLDRGVLPETFYAPAHRILYLAIMDLYLADRPVDLISVPEKLRAAGDLEKAGGLVYVEGLIDGCPTSAHAEHYIGIILERAAQRTLIDCARKIIEGAHHTDRSPIEVSSQAAAELLKIGESAYQHENPEEFRRKAEAEWMDAKKYADGEGGAPPGIPSKWMPLENLLGSYRPKQNIVIGARPSCGKTIIMCNEVEYSASLGNPEAIISLEMPAEDLRKRMAGARARESTFRLLRGHASHDQIKATLKEFDALNKLPIHIFDKRTTIDRVEAWMTYAYEKWGIKRVWLDYLTLIQDHTGGKGDWVRIVGELCARIKERGKQLGINTVCIAQFSRLGQKTETENTPPAPTLEALRDSGEIEQHADVVVLVGKQPDMPTSSFTDDNPWPMEWNVAKNRGGPTSRFPMVMIRKEQRYVTKTQHDDMKRAEKSLDSSVDD